ncbi:RNase H family protein [Nocardiopsis ansamitocini]|uniref:RNase H family protein n=1 Tax=Nocardiopsis ansamitocini TaxID=1670832 RepID=UPI002556CB96|nr:RNase H family protein [Nocardiopsis ansamitocini]
MAPDEFDACAGRLPPRLAGRARALRGHVVYSPAGPRRRSVSEAMALAFDAAHVGDLAAAESMLARAEALDAEISARRAARTLSGHHGRVQRWSGTTPLVAATDASVKGRHAGMGYVTSDGRWGMRSWGSSAHDPSGPSRVLVQELRAVALLLQVLAADTPAVLLVDSAVARRYLRLWQSGGTPELPAGYDAAPRRAGRLPSLVRLGQAMAERPGIQVTAVKGHSGHLLNETADSLAGMARRRLADPGARSTSELIEHADGFVASFLGQWHSGTRTGPDAQTRAQRDWQKQKRA